MRAARARELVAEGYRPTAVARVAQVSRQAIYNTPKRSPQPLALADPAPMMRQLWRSRKPIRPMALG